MGPVRADHQALRDAVEEGADRLREEGGGAERAGHHRAAEDDAEEATGPVYFTAALKKNKQASATFAGFSPSHRREYIEWITEAKTDATRDRRLATAIEWMSEGKGRNWKYERHP